MAFYLTVHHHAFYPEFKDGITHVSQAYRGSGLRKYIGSEQHASRGYTLIDIDVNIKLISASIMLRTLSWRSVLKVCRRKLRADMRYCSEWI
ncbi:MAG: hypothetical protein DRR42_24465 [Gammaproteobacteria bacterium]|nr:MAG: hypothetical protein DRR42_24465 [Gammaproteobacteria bacterium]